MEKINEEKLASGVCLFTRLFVRLFVCSFVHSFVSFVRRAGNKARARAKAHEKIIARASPGSGKSGIFFVGLFVVWQTSKQRGREQRGGEGRERQAALRGKGTWRAGELLV
jgi:hypothetical protein